LTVDLDALDRNIERMAMLVQSTGANLRPHSKSHKTPYIAHRQLVAGARGVCCAKLGEAEAMVAGGIGNVLITSPVVGQGKIARLAALARQAKVSVVVDSPDMLSQMDESLHSFGSRLGMVIEVDVGQNRCGVRNIEDAVTLAREIAKFRHLTLEGMQGYQGVLQQVRNYDERRTLAERALEILQRTAESVRKAGFEIAVLTGGGSGSSQIDIDLGGLTELQAGSYVFMDTNYIQVQWNSSRERIPFEPSLHVISSVVSKPTRDLAVVDAGWKCLSSDAGIPVVLDPFAEEYAFGGDEHGKIRLNEDGHTIRPGDRVTIRPSHCDTTVNLYNELIGLRNGMVESVWEITARGRSD
jgi:D-serine deaminase-like pyridoxal phosphate-dependent protein